MNLFQNALEAYRFFRTAAHRHERTGRIDAAWAALEAAHVLMQRHMVRHVAVHMAMAGLAARTRAPRELFGQMLRVVAAATMTWAWVPAGNSGRAAVPALRSEPIPRDLAMLM